MSGLCGDEHQLNPTVSVTCTLPADGHKWHRSRYLPMPYEWDADGGRIPTDPAPSVPDEGDMEALALVIGCQNHEPAYGVCSECTAAAERVIDSDWLAQRDAATRATALAEADVIRWEARR